MDKQNDYRLILMDHGNEEILGNFETFEKLKQHLIEIDYFSWIKDNEPDRELPKFEDVEDVKDLELIFDEYDYNWWTMIVEVK